MKYRKSLGQNILIDDNIINKIIKKINISCDDIIIEIGAGTGKLSEKLVYARHIFLFELDFFLYEKLVKKFFYNKNITVLNEDFLKFNIKNIYYKYNKVKIIGNVPYNISSKIILNLCNFSFYIKDIYLVLQKEFVDKLSYNNKKFLDYISFISYVNFSVINFFNINPVAFYPIPKIISSFIRLKIKNKKFIINKSLFKNKIKKLFKNKRKMIGKTFPFLKKLYKYINYQKRPEDISLDFYIRIFNLYAVIKTN